MSDSYTKLFASITESTIWCEPAGTRLLWITFLAKSNRHGEVYGSIPGMARLANITLQECEAGLQALLSPDPYSRTPDNEGRRVEPIDGGWRILNHAKFDRARSEIEAEDRERERKRQWDRDNRPSGHARAKQSDDSPTQSDAGPTQSATPPTPAVTTTKDQKQKQGKGADAPALPAWLDPDAWGMWHRYRNGRKGWNADAKRLSLRKLERLRAEGHDPRAVIEQAIERGWTGLFPVHGDARAGPPTAVKPGKQVQGLMALEAMKSGNRLAAGRNFDGAAEALPALTGPHAGR